MLPFGFQEFQINCGSCHVRALLWRSKETKRLRNISFPEQWATIKALTERIEFSERRSGKDLKKYMRVWKTQADDESQSSQINTPQLQSVTETLISGWWASHSEPIQVLGPSSHTERCICQLPSSLKSLSFKKKRKLHFLPQALNNRHFSKEKVFLLLISRTWLFTMAQEVQSCLRCERHQTNSRNDWSSFFSLENFQIKSEQSFPKDWEIF